MKNQSTLTSRIMSLGLFNKVKVFSEWLKLHTTYSRLDYYNHLALSSTASGIEATAREKDITVSLTTYAHRIHSVHLVIESLFGQTIKPNNIVLWLSETEFSEETIPEILKRQVSRGLQIRYCEDLRSYKKIIPALTLFPKDILITADDDIIYPHDHIERLYLAYQLEPEFVHCNRAHLICLESDGSAKPYRAWEYETDNRESSMLVFPTGCTGILYTKDHFDAEVCNTDAFTELCPHADDIWLKLMTARNGTMSKVIAHAKPLHHYLKVPDFQGQSLININRTANDTQLNKLLARYPDIAQKLRM